VISQDALRYLSHALVKKYSQSRITDKFWEAFAADLPDYCSFST